MSSTPWEYTPLGAAGQWLSGGTPPKSRPELWEGELPWVSPKDMKRDRIGDAQDHLSPRALDTAAVTEVPAGTLLMVVRGMILAHSFPVALTTAPVTFNQDIKALVPNEKYAPDFLLYALQSQARGILKLVDFANHGTKRLPTQQLQTLQVPCPPLAEQRKIAAILSSVDDTIERTQAVIDQLEVVKKGLLAELLTRGMPGRHREFKPTRIGPLPATWAVEPLGQLVREPIRNGFSAHAATAPTGWWIAHLGAVTHSGFNCEAIKPVDPTDSRVTATRLEPGDLLVSRSNTRERVGFVGTYRGEPDRCSFPDLLMRVRPSPIINVEFLEQWLLAEWARNYFKTSARGTSGSMVKIDRAILERCLVPVPPLEEQVQIVQSATTLRARIASEQSSLEAAKELKAGLLDSLLTGRIRVNVTDQEAA